MATERVDRARSLTPRRSSRPRIAWLRAEGDTPNELSSWTTIDPGSSTIAADGAGTAMVTITTLNSHNWSQLSPANQDTTKLRAGSRGEVWTFDVKPGQKLYLSPEARVKVW